MLSFKLNPVNAMLIDKYLRVCDTEVVSIEPCKDICVFTLCSPDFSNFTVIRVKKDFFLSYTLEDHEKPHDIYMDDAEIENTQLTYSIPRVSFYRTQMKECLAYLKNDLSLSYTYNHAKSHVVYNRVEVEPFECNIDIGNMMEIDIGLFKRILTSFSGKYVDIEVKQNLMRWSIVGTTVELNVRGEDCHMRVPWLQLKGIFKYHHYQKAYLGVTEENVKIIFIAENVIIETYIRNNLTLDQM